MTNQKKLAVCFLTMLGFMIGVADVHAVLKDRDARPIVYYYEKDVLEARINKASSGNYAVDLWFLSEYLPRNSRDLSWGPYPDREEPFKLQRADDSKIAITGVKWANNTENVIKPGLGVLAVSYADGRVIILTNLLGPSKDPQSTIMIQCPGTIMHMEFVGAVKWFSNCSIERDFIFKLYYETNEGKFLDVWSLINEEVIHRQSYEQLPD